MPVIVTRFLHAVLTLLALLASGTCAAVAVADAGRRIDPLATMTLDHPGYLREVDAGISPRELLGRDDTETLFRPSERATAAFGFSDRAYWLHVRLHNPESVAAERVVAIANPLLDDVDFYLRTGDGQIVQLPGGSRPVVGNPDARHALLRLEPVQSVDLFVRAASIHPLTLPLILSRPDAYADHLQSVRFWLGLLLGAIVALATYNLLLAAALRRRAYLWLVAHLLTFGLLVAVLEGMGVTQWRGLVGDQGRNGIHAVLSLAMLAMLAYTSCRLLLSRQWPAAAAALIAMAGLRGVLAVIAAFVPAAWVAHICIGLLIPEVLVIAGCCVVMAVRGSAPARLLLGGWSLLLLSLLVYALVAFGLVPINLLSSHGLPLGLLVGTAVITFASALRYESLDSQYETATLTASSGLEKGVAERTRTLAQTMAALNEANQRLRDANDRDGLTGAFNRRYFDRNVEAMMSRSRIAQQSFSALVADIDHFKSVNDSAGHLVGDDCIRLVARVLQEHAGPGSAVVRYGGEEFVLLLPGQGAHAAIATAERVRTAVSAETVTTRNQVIRLTISIGVETAAANRRMSPASLIRNADQALYAAKGDGRNRVVHADSLRRPATAD